MCKHKCRSQFSIDMEHIDVFVHDEADSIFLYNVSMMGLENDPTPHRLVEHGMMPTCSGPTFFTRCVCSMKMACQRLDLISIIVVAETGNTSFFRTRLEERSKALQQIHGKDYQLLQGVRQHSGCIKSRIQIRGVLLKPHNQTS